MANVLPSEARCFAKPEADLRREIYHAGVFGRLFGARVLRAAAAALRAQSPREHRQEPISMRLLAMHTLGAAPAMPPGEGAKVFHFIGVATIMVRIPLRFCE